jgi:hypothetical protein
VASEAFAATFRCDPNPPAFFAALAGTLFAAQRFFVERRFPPRCYFVPFFAALAARAFARFATSAAFPAGDSFRLATDFLAAAFLATAGAAFPASARTRSQRALIAPTIAALPALLSFRFGFDASDLTSAGGSDSPRILAHRRCWASFIRRRAAAENFLRWLVGGPGVVAAVGLVPPDSMARSSAI